MSENETKEEVCENCAHCLHAIWPICGKAQSEFYEGMVHPAGWCPWFAFPALPSTERRPMCDCGHPLGLCPECKQSLPSTEGRK